MGAPRRNVLLIFPPGWTVYSPYLALPLLAAYLRRAGYGVQIRDLNIEFFDCILSQGYIEGLRPGLERAWGSLLQGAGHQQSSALARTGKALLAFDYLAGHVESAKGVLRNKEGFLDEATYLWANRVIANSLSLISVSAGLQLSLSGITYDSSLCTNPSWVSSPNIFHAFFHDYVLPSLPLTDYALVGLSISSRDQLLSALCFARAIKSRCPGLHICFGGGYLTRALKLINGPNPWSGLVDSFISFEGEAALADLVSTVEDEERWSDISQLTFERDGALQKNVGGLVMELNQLPTPSFDGFPLELYFSPELILPIYASRGCPWNLCSFCTEPFSSSSYRERDLALVRSRHKINAATLPGNPYTGGHDS